MALVGVALIVFGLTMLVLTEGPRRLLTHAYTNSQRRQDERTWLASLAHPRKWGSQLAVGSHKLGRTLVRTGIRSTGWLLGR